VLEIHDLTAPIVSNFFYDFGKPRNILGSFAEKFLRTLKLHLQQRITNKDDFIKLGNWKLGCQ